MRTLKYLSPSGVKKFDQSEEDFYERYLADTKTPRDPQLMVMAVGSAFDAYIKAYLYKELQIGDDPTFELTALFEEQVEPQNREESWRTGKIVFDAYVHSGAAADLLVMLGDATDIDFEFKLEGAVTSKFVDLANQPGGNPVLLGKPDLYFTHKDGGRVILDWKVNGFYSKKKPSARKGYLRILPTQHGKFRRVQHKDVAEGYLHEIKINLAHRLEVVDADWGRQLAMYGWLLGEDIGADFIVAIDQIICEQMIPMGVAQHRCTVGQEYQIKLFRHVSDIWRRCHNGHFFPDLSREDSEARCRLLDSGPSEVSMEDFGRER